MPPPPGLFLDFFKISFSHINLKYYLSEPDCQSWRGLKEIRKIFQLGYSWPNGMKKSFPKPGFCLCFTNFIQEDLNFVQTNEQQQQQKKKQCVAHPLQYPGWDILVCLTSSTTEM